MDGRDLTSERADRHTARRVKRGIAAGLIVLVQVGAAAQSTDYDEVYAKYLSAARRTPATGALWMGDLMSDRSAHRVNDLVTVRVLESLSATGSADSSVGKSSKAAVAVPTPISKAVAKALPIESNTKFSGNGGTTRTTELISTLTARVTEMLPSGDMVIEGIRELDINGDRTLVVLTGVIRAADIEPGNTIASSSIGQLRIRSLSQGLIHDSLEPGWLIRILNRVF
ncbi:MAG: flagellar basal body L-ring protein FlgH [Vicinamibacterales bacterium]